MLSNSVPSIKIAKESLLSCRTTGVNGVEMFARQQVVAHPVYCALTALTQAHVQARDQKQQHPITHPGGDYGLCSSHTPAG